MPSVAYLHREVMLLRRGWFKLAAHDQDLFARSVKESHVTKVLARHRGSVLTIVPLFMLLGSLLLIARIRPIDYSKHVTPPTAGELAAALGRLGLDPDTLAASGLSANQTTLLVNAAKEYLATGIDDLRTADAAVASAQHDVRRLLDLVQSGRASSQQKDELATARTSLVSARTSQQTALDGTFTAATDGLSNDTRALITTIRSNRGREVPTQYLATNRTDAQWVCLRDSLAHCRVAAARGEDADGGCSSVVSAANAESGTAIAATNLRSNGADVLAAWRAAVGL